MFSWIGLEPSDPPVLVGSLISYLSLTCGTLAEYYGQDPFHVVFGTASHLTVQASLELTV